jgi:hypothetical protein
MPLPVRYCCKTLLASTNTNFPGRTCSIGKRALTVQSVRIGLSPMREFAAMRLPLVKCHTAAHRDGLAGHVGIVEQHHYGLCDFLGFAKAT